MKQVMTACMVVLAVLAWTGGLTAHHSLVRFDTTKILWVKGTVVRFDLVNPHVRFVLEQTTESGQTQRWVVDGPSSNQLARLRIGPDFLKAGDRIEVCGVGLKEEIPDVSRDRPLSGHVLVMPNGRRQFWSDYGVFERCLPPGEDPAAFRREAFGL